VVCSKTKRLFLVWVKEVRTTKSLCEVQRGICTVNTHIFLIM
jgi:hypothetical protein